LDNDNRTIKLHSRESHPYHPVGWTKGRHALNPQYWRGFAGLSFHLPAVTFPLSVAML